MEELAIGTNLKGAAARRNKRQRFDTLAEFENFGRQTDGLRRVVSNDAVFDRHFCFHIELLSTMHVIAGRKCVKECASSADARILASIWLTAFVLDDSLNAIVAPFRTSLRRRS